jgi:hypothetical protein
LTIARGYRFGNFKPSDVTIAAVEEVMLAAGVTPLSEEEEQAKGFDIYARPPARPAAPKVQGAVKSQSKPSVSGFSRTVLSATTTRMSRTRRSSRV